MIPQRIFNVADFYSFQHWKVWPTVVSFCFWEYLFVLVHFLFIGSYVIHYLRKRIIKSNTVKSDTRDETQKIDGKKLSITYHACKVCCALVLVSHILKLGLLLHKGKGSDSLDIIAILTEVVQLISFILLLASVLDFPRIRCLKLSSLLRSWLTCCFLQSAIYMSFDIYFISSLKVLLGLQQYTDILILLSCMFLFVIAIRGKTGIRYSSSSITEPLLQRTSEKHVKSKTQSSYSNASLLQLVTFSWMNPLFAIGIKKPIEKDEVPDVDIKDSAAFQSCSFEWYLNDVKAKQGMKPSSVYKAIFLFIRKKAVINASFAVVSACASYVGPSLIDNLVKFLSGERQNGLTSGYVLVIAFLTAKIVETVTQRQWMFGARQLGMRLRSALTSQIYKKGLNLSCRSRQSHTSGEIINYMSVDIISITDLIWYTNTIWMFPIQITLAMYILQRNLGLGALAALAMISLILACNVPITTLHKKYQSKIMEAKDNRMKATTEVLRSMKILKLQAWDLQYLHKLEDLRNTEYNWVWKAVRLTALSSFLYWAAPAAISIVTFGACILIGIPLTAGRVLSALATFRMLQQPIFNLPDLLSAIAQGKVSADRIASFLQQEEINSKAVKIVPRNEAEFDILIENGSFSWSPEPNHITMQDIELKASKGMKVAICGTVGSGKSSLLSCILGEIPKVSGTVEISGRIAYVPQTPWILSGNVRENIIFGNPFHHEKYEKSIQACALTKDLELFPNGDLTEIGERGINMSGGQKQRIQIARAVYQDADVYLLDDPFSAVDAHTGSQLFKDCLMDILKDKTVVYITHQVEFLPVADLILVMQNGRIRQAGTFDQLLKENMGFEVLVGAHSRALQTLVNTEVSSRITRTDENQTLEEASVEDAETENTADAQFQNVVKQESDQDLSQDISQQGKLMQEEEKEKGSIGKDIYWSYLTALRGGALVPIILMAHSTYQILQIASNYWLAWACPTSTTEPTVGINVVFYVYLLLSIGSSLCVLVRAILVELAGLLTSQKFFLGMLHCIFRAPMSFFDSTPTGRILNRASTDQSVLDLEMAGRVGWCAFTMIHIIGTVTVMSQVAWPIFIIFIPVTVICMWYQQYYIPTARELARLSGIQRAPILHHFAESLAGLSTIRAFGQKDRFTKTNFSLVNNHSRPWFHNISAMEWLSIRLNLLSNFVFAFSLVLLVSLPEGFIIPNIAGLAITYGLNLNSQMENFIWNLCNAENKMISVERILQYSKICSEAPLLIEDQRPPENWPGVGTICFKNLEVRYAEHLPSVLKNLTCTIPGQKKVGVVGRTGSGKSTLIQALFRIIEPREGNIEIDGVDICKMGLHDLRSRLSIIPQDPTMFEGTVRGNLDPLMEHSDQKIWEVLDKCQLGDLIRQNDKKLDSAVVENGENWSVGQRQLFCLGRVLLKKSSILVLDEATASIDSATDRIIQQILCHEFSDCTVITIAHRIHTVIDSDLILVLSEGRIVEYDEPSKLLEREDSSFSKLIKEYSMRSRNFSNRI